MFQNKKHENIAYSSESSVICRKCEFGYTTAIRYENLKVRARTDEQERNETHREPMRSLKSMDWLSFRTT